MPRRWKPASKPPSPPWCALTADTTKRKVAYGTEAGLFQNIGIPTVVCGPGNIEQAHKPSEFVEISQLEACERFLRKLGQSL